MRRLRILTWHLHGSYLYSLAHLPHDIVVPVRPGRPAGYAGLPKDGGFPWPDSLSEMPAESLRDAEFDCVIFQGRSQWEVDQHELLTSAQRARPRIYLEHDPPQEHPTDTRHFVDDRGTLLVHVTPFNALMWDSGRTPSLVIDHGVTVPDGVACTGELPRAIAVVDDIATRGRHLGMDVLDTVRADVPVDLAGAGSLDAGGIGEVPHDRLHAFVARYRAFFNPSRYTSLDRAVCEAMMLGLPVVGLATTEMATAIERGISGYVDTDPRVLAEMLRHLLAHPEEARRLGANARRYARERFNIDRFVRDWNSALAWVTGPVASPRSLASGVPS